MYPETPAETPEMVEKIAQNKISLINFILKVDRDKFQRSSQEFNTPYEGHYFWIGREEGDIWIYEIRGLEDAQLDDFQSFHEKMPGFVSLT